MAPARLERESTNEGGAVRASEDAFREVVEQVIDYAIFVLDREGRVASWNAGAHRMTGYAAGEMIGRHVSTFYRPEDAWKCRHELDVAVRDGRVEDEGWRVRRDGSLFWANVVITARHDSHRNLVGFVKVTRDLTERRKAEETLRLSEERFRLLVASIQDYAIFMLDPAGRVETWNQGAERLTGFRAGEIVGQHFSRFMPEEEVRSGKCERVLETAQREGRSEDESWSVRKDGARFWAHVVITALRDAEDRVVGFANVTRDLTDRLRAEEHRIRLAEETAARRSDERVLAWLTRLHGVMGLLAAARTPEEIATVLVDQCTTALGATAGVFVRSVDPRQLEVVAARGVSGAVFEPLRRFPVDALVPWSSAYRSRAPEWVENREEYVERYRDLSDRALAPASSAALPLLVGDGVAGVLAFLFVEPRRFTADERVLTQALALQAAEAFDRAEAYAKEVTARQALERAVRLRDEVLEVVAHDLRNPINVISMSASSLMQRLSDSTLRRSAERITRSVQRAEHLLRDLLEVNAIEGGRFSIDARQVDTASLILAALESQQSLLASASVILATDLAPALPPVDADHERVFQLFENLIGNAIKFTKAGGSVSVGASRREQEVLIWIKDTGSGIAPEQLPHLFDRFWQATPKDKRGAGLGLTICKAIVEAHGGRIWAESTPGEGTTIFFTLPAAVGRSPQAHIVEIVNILLVDDLPENLLALKAILERPDYRLVFATSGEEALSLALRQTFDVALVDIAMPRMDGLEVARHLKALERSREIPIIFITAYGDDPKEIHRAYEAGGADYLVKPLEPELVRKKVAVFADLSRKRSHLESRAATSTG